MFHRDRRNKESNNASRDDADDSQRRGRPQCGGGQFVEELLARELGLVIESGLEWEQREQARKQALQKAAQKGMQRE